MANKTIPILNYIKLYELIDVCLSDIHSYSSQINSTQNVLAQSFPMYIAQPLSTLPSKKN